MNIWDSVHRGLEKASNEAGRIARAQRLRSSIDKVGRQIRDNEAALLNTVMQLFSTGALTQTELQPLCQEIVQLRQQLMQTQADLQQLNAPQAQAQPPVDIPAATVPPTQLASAMSNPYVQQTENNPYQNVTPTLPPDHPYANTGSDTPTPPPPPGITDISTPIPTAPPPPSLQDPTISSFSTQFVPPGNPAPANTRHCPQCGTPTQSANAFCQNCGTALTDTNASRQTMLSASSLQFPLSNNETVRADVSQETVRASQEDQPGTQVQPDLSDTPPTAN